MEELGASLHVIQLKCQSTESSVAPMPIISLKLLLCYRSTQPKMTHTHLHNTNSSATQYTWGVIICNNSSWRQTEITGRGYGAREKALAMVLVKYIPEPFMNQNQKSSSKVSKKLVLLNQIFQVHTSRLLVFENVWPETPGGSVLGLGQIFQWATNLWSHYFGVSLYMCIGGAQQQQLHS